MPGRNPIRRRDELAQRSWLYEVVSTGSVHLSAFEAKAEARAMRQTGRGKVRMIAAEQPGTFAE